MDYMTGADWNELHTLTRDYGNWGEWKRVSRALVYELDRFATDLGIDPLVTSTTTGLHSKNSLHYVGQAIDCMFPGVSLGELPKKVFERALRYNFSGLGIYNEWRLHYGAKPIGGMHFELEGEIAPLKKKLWVRTKDGDFGPTAEVLLRYFPTLPPPDIEA